MRICMLTSFFLPTIGGVEAHVYHLTKCLQKMGHEVVVVHTCFDLQPADGVRYTCELLDGIEIHRIYITEAKLPVRGRFMSANLISYVNGFLRKIKPMACSQEISAYILRLHKEKKFDLVHQHDFISNIFTTKRLSRRLPIVLTNHTGEFLLLKRYTVLSPILRFLLCHVDFLIGPSKELCEVNFLQKRNRVAYIENGVDIETFIPKEQEEIETLRICMGYTEGIPLVLCARRWAPTKGVIYMVKAIKLVLEKYPRVHFLISGNEYYGYPEYRNEILTILHEDGVAGAVSLLGDIPHADMSTFYQISDIVVLPSLMEATSLSGLEAMSCGKALLGTNVGGIPEIIEDGRSGYLVPAGDSEALADTLVKMLNDMGKVRAMGQRGRTLAEEKFSWNSVAEKTLEIYMKVCKQHKI